MNGMDTLAKTIISATNKKRPQSYFTQAKVIKVDGDIAWVHLPNGTDQTPVRKTINCKADDIVEVRVGDGTAVIVGNASAPPTDDTRAIKADVEALKAKADANKALTAFKVRKIEAEPGPVRPQQAATFIYKFGNNTEGYVPIGILSVVQKGTTHAALTEWKVTRDNVISVGFLNPGNDTIVVEFEVEVLFTSLDVGGGEKWNGAI